MTWIRLGYRKTPLPLLFCLALLALAATFPPTAAAQPGVIRVAAAADMEPVLQVMGPIFERKSGQKLKVSFGSSATLAQQLQNGSPADLFLSADFYFAEQVVAANLAETRQPVPYATGLLVLWARKDSRFKPLSLEALERKDLKAVAIANQDRAPYGRAAYAALKKMGLYPNVAPHIVEAETVAQAAQFALSGNADLALMSQTVAMSPKYRDAGTFVLFPPSQYPAIRQCAVVMKNASNRDGAHRLLSFLTSNEVQGNLPKLGLQAAK